MSRILRAAVAALVVLVGVLLPAAAHAERWTAEDAVGDVTGLAFNPDPTPCGTFTHVDASADTNADITGLSVRHTRKDVRLEVGLNTPDPALEQAVIFHIAAPGVRGWSVEVDRHQGRHGKFWVSTDFAKEPDYPDPADLGECSWFAYWVDERACATEGSVDLDARTVSVTVPRTCLKNPRWIQVGVTAHHWTYSEDPADHTTTAFSDEWGSPDEAASPWLPPFSPRVHAGPGASTVEPPAPRPVAGQRRERVVIASQSVRLP